MRAKIKKSSHEKGKIKEVKNLKKETSQTQKITKGGIICNICHKILRSRYHLKIHMTVHTGEKNYKCEICKKCYQQKWNLVTHIARVHSKEKPFKCNDCGKAYGYSSHFKRHVKTHFLEKIDAPDIVKKIILNPFKCEFCEKSFESNYRLVIHTRTHTGNKPYVCDKCGKSFSNKRMCALHIQKIHSPSEPYQHSRQGPNLSSNISHGIQTIYMKNEQLLQHQQKNELILCEVCGKSISRQSLKKHLNIHYRNRVYTCYYCEKMFLESGQKIIHERKHTGEKPYACDICGQGHTQYGNVLTHGKKSHDSTRNNQFLWKRNNPMWNKTPYENEKSCKTTGTEHPLFSNEELTKSEPALKYTGNETIEEFLRKAGCWVNKRFQQSKRFSSWKKSNSEENCFTDVSYDESLKVDDALNKINTESKIDKVENKDKNFAMLKIKQKINIKIYEKLVEELKKSSIRTKVLQVVEKIENSKKENFDILKEFLKEIKNFPNNIIIIRKQNGLLFWHCWVCESKFKNRHLLARHLFIHEPEENRPFKCDVCRKTFTQSNNYKEHVMSHSNENQYYCDKCGSGFRHKSHFNTHVKKHDPAAAEPIQNKFECSFCGKKMRTNYQKTEHERTHTKEKPFLCKICGQQFGASSTLSRHLSTHTDAKHKCTICLKNFRQKSNLKRHYGTHSHSDTRFVCDCGKTFSQSSSLKKHKMICKSRTEPVLKPFTCLICCKKFLTRSDLKRHLATHDSEKKFKCLVCFTMLKTSETFKAHMKRHNEFYKKKYNSSLTV